VPTRARVHRGDEERARGKAQRARGARQHDLAGLQGLAQRLQRGAVELGQLVEEQHAVVRQADLARTRHAGTAADEPRRRGGVVRRAEGPRRRQAGADVEARRRTHAGDLHRLVRQERREDARQPPGEHRLAGARPPDEAERVAARRGDLQRAPRGALPAHVGEVRPGTGALVGRRGHGDRRARLVAGEERDDVVDAARGADLDAFDQGGLGGVFGGDHDPGAAGGECGLGGGQRAAHRSDLAGERELAEEQGAVDGGGRHGAGGGEQADGDREVEAGPVLLPVGRREVHRDAPQRELKPAVLQRRLYADAGLANRRLRQAHRRVRRQPAGQIDLDVDGHGVDAAQRRRERGDVHSVSS
jgi:hypothetical protein